MLPNTYKKKSNDKLNDIKKLHVLNDSHFFKAILSVWLTIFLFIFTAKYLTYQTSYGYLFYPVYVFLIASRMGALLQLIHEAAHGLLVKNKKLNALYSDIFCALPIGITHTGYTRGHALHHAHTGTQNDPASDREKYKEPNFSKANVYWLLLKDLLCVTALNIFFSYQNNSLQVSKKGMGDKKIIITLFRFILVQLFLLIFLFNFSIFDYIIFWFYPAAGPHMFLMRFRGIAEHGLAGQLGIKVNNVREGNFYTRSFGTSVNNYQNFYLTFLERLFIGSYNVYYHHEHHLYPMVPFYNLPKLHELIKNDVKNANPDVYEKGYFSAALRNLTRK